MLTLILLLGLFIGVFAFLEFSQEIKTFARKKYREIFKD